MTEWGLRRGVISETRYPGKKWMSDPTVTPETHMHVWEGVVMLACCYYDIVLWTAGLSMAWNPQILLEVG